MSWPSTTSAWLTYLRQFRRRSAEDQQLLAALAAIQASVVDVWSALDAARRIPEPHVAITYDGVRATIDAIEVAIDLYVRPENLDTRLYEERVALARTLRAVQLQLCALRTIAGIFLSRKILDATVQRRVVDGVRAYRIRAGETLASIASTQLGNRDRWTELVELNGLQWPYIGDHADYPAVIAPGEVMLLPSPDAASTVLPSLDPSADDLFGVDLDLTSTPGQVRFSNGDLSLIVGVPNIEQAVRHRIRTARGSLELHPEYGSNVWRWVGVEGVAEVTRLALFDYIRAVQEDPRIQSINRRTATLDGTRLFLALDAVVVGVEQPVRINAILPAIGGAT